MRDCKRLWTRLLPVWHLHPTLNGVVNQSSATVVKHARHKDRSMPTARDWYHKVDRSAHAMPQYGMPQGVYDRWICARVQKDGSCVWMIVCDSKHQRRATSTIRKVRTSAALKQQSYYLCQPER
jgi:hypothetical protein